MILEIGQIRLHDEGVAEGAGDVSFTLRDVSVGITAADVERTVRENLQSDPTAFLDLAEQILDASRGAPDIFYVHVPPSAAPEEAGDWLYFVTPMDIPLGDDGRREREYAYAHPAFFADPGLTRQVSSRTRVDGDEVHEKVRVDAGDRVYVEDDTGAVFVLEIGGKPSAHTISIEVRRVR